MEINELDAINTKVTSYGANLLPVVKNRCNEEIKFLYDFGFRVFGENRLEDYKLHYSMYKDVNYHFIAPVQSRKLAEINEKFDGTQNLKATDGHELPEYLKKNKTKYSNWIE